MTFLSNRQRARFAIVAGMLALLVSVSSVSAQRRDPDRRPPNRKENIRSYWKFDGPGNRYLRSVGKNKWAEYQNGRLYKTYTERERCDEYIELTTTMPQLAIVRVYNQKIVWRPGNDRVWRRGANGGWIDPDKGRKDRRDPKDRRRDSVPPRRDR